MRITYFFKVLILTIGILLLSANYIFGQTPSSSQNIEELIDEIENDSLEAIIREVFSSDAPEALSFKEPVFSNVKDIYTLENVPNPKKIGDGYVSDPNNYINTSQELEINQLIWQIEQKTTAQIAIVMLPSIGSEVPKDFAVKLFEKWGIKPILIMDC